jgi:predicted O-methyltransferase YrrM
MARGKEVPFDFVFIDADKPNIPAYFEYALRFSKPGTLVVVDNVVREGQLADGSSTDEAVLALRKFHEMVASERRVTATTLQTVGRKGYDGLTILIVHE